MIVGCFSLALNREFVSNNSSNSCVCLCFKLSIPIITWKLWLHIVGFLIFFLAFDFCAFCVVFQIFHPRHNSQWPPTSKDFYTRSYPLHYLLILILDKEPVFPFSMFSAKQGNYWYHFCNVFSIRRSLTGDWTLDLPHSMPALYH